MNDKVKRWEKNRVKRQSKQVKVFLAYYCMIFGKEAEKLVDFYF